MNNTDKPIEPLPAPSGSAVCLHRISVQYDGVEIIGGTVKCKRPENHHRMTELIRELLRCMEAKDVSDTEVLGSVRHSWEWDAVEKKVVCHKCGLKKNPNQPNLRQCYPKAETVRVAHPPNIVLGDKPDDTTQRK